jgi:hypothetical protein
LRHAADGLAGQSLSNRSRGLQELAGSRAVEHHLLALAAMPHQAHGAFFNEVDVPRWRTGPEELLRRNKLEQGDTRLQREWKA